MKSTGRIVLSWWPEETRPENAEEINALVEQGLDSAYGDVRLGWTSDGWRVDEASLSEPIVYSSANKLTGPQDRRQSIHEILEKAGLPMAPRPQ